MSDQAANNLEQEEPRGIPKIPAEKAEVFEGVSSGSMQQVSWHKELHEQILETTWM